MHPYQITLLPCNFRPLQPLLKPVTIRLLQKLCLTVLLLIVFSASAGATHVVINSDRVLEIDGKKVFVIGFTLAPPPDGKTPDGKNAIEELADAGATFVRAGPGGSKWNEEKFAAEKKMQDAAAKYGLHCWLNLRELSSIKPVAGAQEKLLRRVIATFKDHPGMGVWKGDDEPEWGKRPLAPLQHVYDLLKQLDPNHPLALIQAPRGTIDTLKKYNPACDIVGIDIYPIGYPPGKHSEWVDTNSDISMVGDYTKEMEVVSEGKKAVWMTLQIAWSGVENPGKTLRFPTFPEQRFMTYQAIINGARGLTYFGGNLETTMPRADAKLGWNWTFWRRVLRPVVEEIGTKSPLYPALVAPASKLPIRVSGQNIEFCAREVGPDLFIIACSRGHSTELVEFSGIPGSVKNGDVLFEEPRKIAPKDGQFKDWFAPFEVHVYRLRPG
jgi:hypothetical protein